MALGRAPVPPLGAAAPLSGEIQAQLVSALTCLLSLSEGHLGLGDSCFLKKHRGGRRSRERDQSKEGSGERTEGGEQGWGGARTAESGWMHSGYAGAEESFEQQVSSLSRTFWFICAYPICHKWQSWCLGHLLSIPPLAAWVSFLCKPETRALVAPHCFLSVNLLCQQNGSALSPHDYMSRWDVTSSRSLVVACGPSTRTPRVCFPAFDWSQDTRHKHPSLVVPGARSSGYLCQVWQDRPTGLLYHTELGFVAQSHLPSAVQAWQSGVRCCCWLLVVKVMAPASATCCLLYKPGRVESGVAPSCGMEGDQPSWQNTQAR